MQKETNEREIIQLFEDGDHALISADIAEIRRIYADDYLQHDERGNPSTRDDLIHNLTSGKVRFVSMSSSGRVVRFIRDDIAVVHGSENDVVEQERKRSTVRYLYMDVVAKREGRWQIVASQLVKLTAD